MREPVSARYLTFRVGAEEYGVEILKVRELIKAPVDITRVPHAPEGLKGVVNLRGKITPVVELRGYLGLPAGEVARPVIIVVQHPSPEGLVTTGVLVDQVLEVRDLWAGQIEPAPRFGADQLATRFIRGIARTEKRLLLLIDLELVLAQTNPSIAVAA